MRNVSVWIQTVGTLPPASSTALLLPPRLRTERGDKEDVVTTHATGPLTKRERVVYRTATGLVVAVMVFSIFNFVFNDHFPFPNGPEGAFVHLGFPRYFKVELTIAKILG